MRRRLFTAASVLSFLLFVATVYAWVWSEGVFSYWSYRHFTGASDAERLIYWRKLGWGASCGLGTVDISWGHDPYNEADGDPHRRQDEFARHVDDPPLPEFLYARVVTTMSGSVQGKLTEYVHVAGCQIAVFDELGGAWTWKSASMVLPFWLLAACFGLLPAFAVGAFAKRRIRKYRGGCAKCGYNLTGNTSGVCPECGAEVISHATP